MVFKIDDKGFGLGSLITEFGNTSKIIPEAKKIIESFNLEKSIDDWDLLGEAIGTTDKHMLAYLKTTKAGEATVEGYNSYIKSLGKSFDFTALKAKALNIALNVGVMLAVTLAVQGAIAAFDHFTVTLEEQQEKVKTLTDEYSAISEEIETLFQKELTSPMDNALTESETARLEYLRKYRSELEDTLRLAKEDEMRTRFFGGTLDSGISGKINKIVSSSNIEAIANPTQALLNTDDYQENLSSTLGYAISGIKDVQAEYKKLQPQYTELLGYEKDLKEAIALTTDEANKRDFEALLGNVQNKLSLYETVIEEFRKTGLIPFEDISQSAEDAGEALENGFADKGKSAFETLESSMQKYITSFAETEKSANKGDIEKALEDISEQAKNGTISWEEYEKASKQAALALKIGDGDMAGQINDLQSSFELLNTAQKEFAKTGELTAETFSSVLKLVPEAVNSMGDYGNVIDMVKSKIAEQEDIAVLTYGNIVLANNEAVEAIINSHSNLPTALSIYYGTDFDNFVKTSDGKYKVEAKTISKLSELWAKYAGMSAGAIDKQIENMSRAGVSGMLSAQNESILKDMILYRDLFESIENSFNDFAPDYTKPKAKSSSKSEKDAWLEAYKKEYEELQFLRDTNQITQQENYDRLIALDKKYFEGKEKYISEHRRNLEELYKLQKTLFEDYVSDVEHQISILSRQGNSEEDIIAAYKSLQEAVHTEANKYRELGLEENSEQIQALQKQWFDYEDNVLELQKRISEKAIAVFDDNDKTIEVQISLLGEDDIKEKLYLLEKQFDNQQGKLKLLNEQMRDLTQQYISGKINASYFQSQLKELNNEIMSSVQQAKQYRDTLNSLELSNLKNQKDAIFDIVDLTKQLIRQEVNDRVKALEKDIELYNKQKDLLSDQIDYLNEQLDIEKEIADEKKKSINEDLKAYQERVRSAKELLSIEQEQRSYQQGLDERQLSVSKIQDRLIEIQNDDSLSARAERAKLQDELANKQLELDNYIFDNNIENQQRALDKELERYERSAEKELELIDRNLKAYEDSAKRRIDLINEESKEYDRLSENVRSQIASVQAEIENSGELTRLAMARIDQDGDKLYQDLINWNYIYGTGIDQDIVGAWQNYLNLVDRGNSTTLETTVELMERMVELSKELSYSADYGSFGVRDYFESRGSSVGWNDSTKEFSIDGTYFSSKGYSNIDGALYTTIGQLKELEKMLSKVPKAATGGYVLKDGLAQIHKDEVIASAGTTKKLGAMIDLVIEGQNKLMSLDNLALNNLSSVTPKPTLFAPVYQIEVQGIATDKVVENLKDTMLSMNQSMIADFNKQMRYLGGRTTMNPY